MHEGVRKRLLELDDGGPQCRQQSLPVALCGSNPLVCAHVCQTELVTQLCLLLCILLDLVPAQGVLHLRVLIDVLLVGSLLTELEMVAWRKLWLGEDDRSGGSCGFCAV